MEEDKKSNPGAPATDTTSALFVPARKKQLQQQEEEQRAREKEEKRLVAEAEVRRLEQEVEERRRKVAEEARKAEEEARRIAEEARAREAETEANPDDAILGKAPEAQPAGKGFNMPGIGVGKPGRDKADAFPAPEAPKAQPEAGSAAKGGLAAKVNKDMIPIIGGAAAVVIIAIIAIVMITGSGSLPGGFKQYSSSEAGLKFAADENWKQEIETWDSFYYPMLGIWAAKDEYAVFLVNFSNEYQEMHGKGLHNKDILGEFVYMLSDDIPGIEYASDITYQKTDQANRYTANVSIGSRPYSASISIYPDGSCVAALVSSSTPEDENLWAVLDSASVLK